MHSTTLFSALFLCTAFANAGPLLRNTTSASNPSTPPTKNDTAADIKPVEQQADHAADTGKSPKFIESPHRNGTACSPAHTKWVPRDALNSAILTFCAEAEKQGVQDKNSGALQRNYLSGNDALSLSIEWDPGDAWKPTKDTCVKNMDSIMDGCNSGSNPMNWKHGGYFWDGYVKFLIDPLKDRGYKPGLCSFHLHEEMYFSGSDGPGTSQAHTYFLRDSIKDGNGTVISTVDNDAGFDDGNPYVCNSFYAPLKMTPEYQNGNYIQFSIGDQSWTTKDTSGSGGHCNVGDWDSKLTPVGRDMDCFFPC